jgi:hypothetical protein
MYSMWKFRSFFTPDHRDYKRIDSGHCRESLGKRKGQIEGCRWRKFELYPDVKPRKSIFSPLISLQLIKYSNLVLSTVLTVLHLFVATNWGISVFEVTKNHRSIVINIEKSTLKVPYSPYVNKAFVYIFVSKILSFIRQIFIFSSF